MAASIVEIDLTSVNDVLTNNILQRFELVSYTTTTVPILEAGRSEEIGGALYQVTGGNLTPTGSPSDGVVYLYVEDTGASVTATLSNTVPTWTGQGYYNGNAKATHVMRLSGSTYSDKARILTEGAWLGQFLEAGSIKTDTIGESTTKAGITVSNNFYPQDEIITVPIGVVPNGGIDAGAILSNFGVFAGNSLASPATAVINMTNKDVISVVKETGLSNVKFTVDRYDKPATTNFKATLTTTSDPYPTALYPIGDDYVIASYDDGVNGALYLVNFDGVSTIAKVGSTFTTTYTNLPHVCGLTFDGGTGEIVTGNGARIDILSFNGSTWSSSANYTTSLTSIRSLAKLTDSTFIARDDTGTDSVYRLFSWNGSVITLEDSVTIEAADEYNVYPFNSRAVMLIDIDTSSSPSYVRVNLMGLYVDDAGDLAVIPGRRTAEINTTYRPDNVANFGNNTLALLAEPGMAVQDNFLLPIITSEFNKVTPNDRHDL